MIALKIIPAFFAAVVSLTAAGGAVSQPVCKPVLAVKQINFSEMHAQTMERRWTATVFVDASRCASTSGRFAVGFSRLKENAPEIDFREQFMWKSPSTIVAVYFWADEAAESYWVDSVAPCPCLTH